MTDIQFYNTCQPLADALLYCCRLIEKVSARGLPILVHAPNETVGKQLDELLWSFQESAFIGHATDDEHQQVNISWGDNPGEHHHVLINLGTQVPSWHGRFEKVLEIIYDQKDVIESKRNSFRYYKERGYPLRYHDLSK
ncbi:DNA polymerase III subunit chi [Porticoccus sp. W117]|uniref:DNA polymerase III subunit chi n=1 Tax=Porticoccus sp. W117 TaxID=3054777 RepID=UPI002599E9EB|nr:DNA polymerase III subunit chi [Porticoccus sp. W117]MDM3869955.1 DNA polymerase III subunit chi [Porticoccus sp. W117]